MPDTEIRFGGHEPESVHRKAQNGPAAVFTRGESALIPGTQWKYRFDNGYGASVIDDGYGGNQGLYELAVLDAGGRITYETPITDDVLGWLTPDEVTEALDRIAALPAAEATR